ncbi:hypothetical protein AAHC03_02059 [Spirometra sp. Aus1]
MTAFLLLMLFCFFRPRPLQIPLTSSSLSSQKRPPTRPRNPIEGTWGKIEAISEYGDNAPVIDDDVGDDVRRYPATDTIFYSPKYQTGVSFYGEKGLLEVTECSTLNPAVTAEVDDKLVKFKTSEKKCWFTLICHLSTERSKNVTYTASLLLIARDEIHYFPPLLSVYARTDETCPLTVDKVINPMNCMVNEMKLNSPESALVTCELKQSNITCGPKKTLEQTVSIIDREDFDLQWTRGKNPYRAKLTSDRLRLEDLEEYRCWWATLDSNGVVDITGDMDIPHKRFCLRCIAFLGNKAVSDHLYPPKMAIESISVELVNNEKNFIIGEETPPILVRGYDDSKELSPEFIFCTGLPFKSPHLLIQNVRTEGEKEVVCYAVGNGIKGSDRKFRLGFYCECLRHMTENL